MEQFFQQLTNGLAVGGIYALIALGYTMVYGVLKLKGVSTSLQLFFMTASMAWRPWSQCPDMWSALFAQPAQQVGEKEALGLWQSGG